MSKLLRVVGVGMLAVAFGSSPGLAQTGGSEPPAFNTIRTPASPAFTLLGLAPTAVERPNTIADFALAIAKSVKDLETVPQNFSIEASPYWLRGHPSLKWDAEIDRTLGQSLARTFALSVATAETGKKDAPVTSLAVGVRSAILSGHLSEATVQRIRTLESNLSLLARVYLLELNKRAEEVDAELLRKIAAAKTEEARQAAVAEHKEAMAAIAEATTNSKQYRESPEFKRVSKMMDDFAAAREGLMLEVAAAGRWAFANAEWSSHDFNRRSLWATPSYVTQSWSVVGVARYIADDARAATTMDWGGRAIISRDRYGWSLEYVRRFFPRLDALHSQYRFVGIADYEVRNGTWLTVTFGRDHNSSEKGGLVAQLGLAFNFAQDRFLKP